MKEASHKTRIWYDSIYMECPQQANPWRQKVDWCLPGAWRRGRREAPAGEYGDSFLGDENILKSAVIMVNKPVNILKPAELHTLKGESYACE